MLLFVFVSTSHYLSFLFIYRGTCSSNYSWECCRHVGDIVGDDIIVRGEGPNIKSFLVLYFRIGSHEHERSTTPREYILAFICIYKSSIIVIITLAILTNTLLLDIIHTATTFITIMTIINVMLELIVKDDGEE